MLVLRFDRSHYLLLYFIRFQASLNGHPGVIVTGGYSSDEFYNTKTGTWLQMPSMRKSRSGHVMTITRGKLEVCQDYSRSFIDIIEYSKVAGGEQSGRPWWQIFDDVEIFTG